MSADPYYYQSKLRDIQGQRALTTGRGLSPEETTGILNSELDARYAGEDRRRQYALQQQQLAIQQDAAKRAGEAANVQAIAGTVGGVGQLALGGTALYGMGKQAGWWGATQGATPAITSAGSGTMAGGTTAALSTNTAAGMTMNPVTGELSFAPATEALTSGGMGSISSVALPVAAVVADIWSAEQIRRGTSSYGRGGQSATPWNDSSKWGVAANLIFPIPGVVGGIIGGIKGGIDKVAGTVICTELHRQGYMPEIVLMYDHEYRIGNIGEDVYMGYRTLADPIVRLMQRSKIFTWLIKPFGLATAYEMAHRANPDIKGSKLGSVILKYGIPLCRFARRRNYTWQTFYKA